MDIMIVGLLVAFLFHVRVVLPEEIVRYKNDIKVKTTNYPDNYPSNSSKTWRFRHQDGKWSVHVDQFVLENSHRCGKDYLEITDLSTSKSVRFCGVKPRGPLFISNGSEIVLKFQSDGSTENRGFHLEVFHFFTTADIEKTLKERKWKNSAKITVYKEKDNSWIFYTLLSVLALFLIVFVVLLICFIVSVNKKNHRENRHYQKNVVFQNPIIVPKSRRYSRSKTRVEPVPTNIVHSPIRYV